VEVNRNTGANEGTLGKLRRSLQMDAGGGFFITLVLFALLVAYMRNNQDQEAPDGLQ
jgi:hypothetical protein